MGRSFLRRTGLACVGLPPYQEAILSSADLADIHAWLQSLPRAQDAKSIPLLNP